MERTPLATRKLENYFDKQLQDRALKFVQKLESATRRIFPSSIDTVFVVSGTWRDFANRDRIRAGAAIVREITATKLNIANGKTRDITKEDILQMGPILVYNGTEEENEQLKESLTSPFSKIPEQKVIVLDNYIHKNTYDQFKSFFTELANPGSKLFEAQNVAILSHIPQFIRIPFYGKKFEDELLKPKNRKVSFFAYGLEGRKGNYQDFIKRELEKLVIYAERGHLATEPLRMGTLLS